MTRIKFLFSENSCIGFEISGHSDYADEGEDIVCAAISSAALLTANTITEIIGVDADAKADDDGYLKFVVSASDAENCKNLFAGLELHLSELSKQYPHNMKVISTEV